MSARTAKWISFSLVVLVTTAVAAQQRPQNPREGQAAGENPRSGVQDPRAGQDQQPPREEPLLQTLQRTLQQGQAQSLDQYLAQWLIAKNQAEIELARFAQQQTQDEQVQQYARRMVNEHQQLVQKLQQIASTGSEQRQNRAFRGDPSEQERLDDQPRQDSPQPKQPRQQPGQTDRQPRPNQGQQQPEQKQPTPPARPQGEAQKQLQAPRDAPPSDGQRRQPQPGQAGTASQGSGQPAQQLVDTISRVENQIASSLKKGLQNKQGPQFDRSFMGIQVLGHMAMLDTLEVMKSEASGQLQQTIEQAQQSVEQHLQQAEQLNEQLGQETKQQRR